MKKKKKNREETIKHYKENLEITNSQPLIETDPIYANRIFWLAMQITKDLSEISAEEFFKKYHIGGHSE